MQPFSWYRATTLQAAVARLGDEPDARFIAGGIGLIPAMKARQVKVATLIDISGLTALREISEVGGRLRIGALTSHQEVARSPLVRARCPALASLAQSIGDPQVRHRGTLGGALATNDPAGDWPTAALGLDAEIETDRRTISAGRFLLGPYATALARDEAIVAVTFRVPKASAYLKVIRKSLRYAFVGVFIARFALQPRGSSSDVRVAVTGGAGGTFRLAAAEAALAVQFEEDALADLVAPTERFATDLHGSAAYREHLFRVLVRRAVAATRSDP